eukprot:CAMPEP_0115080992 /NCGR_PEP_ID=MMETSP0227-20121206/19001_1 /TAXON_ID=89957 /ORGANISM="Polarella glacialis, Strain CCMP 1383" /LENGTH=149 /DNA_ID=CAMNT_0002468727 /DNA_START=628 /DNA_END=1078 /DNA_ORIENTATION=-
MTTAMMRFSQSSLNTVEGIELVSAIHCPAPSHASSAGITLSLKTSTSSAPPTGESIARQHVLNNSIRATKVRKQLLAFIQCRKFAHHHGTALLPTGPYAPGALKLLADFRLLFALDGKLSAEHSWAPSAELMDGGLESTSSALSAVLID